ncbi:MAG: hypothetical protein Q4F57_08400 [Weeksellaceae bacterium]|nr:hypothetical protein [Weeksellaceae bacterium]
MANVTSQHILNTSAQLLGFCLIVITSLHFTNYKEQTYIDEGVTGIAIVLIASSMLSFAAIRTENARKEKFFENLADYLFIVALTGIAVLLVFLFMHTIKK